MNSIRHYANKLTTAVCLLVVCSSLLVACGGGGDGHGGKQRHGDRPSTDQPES